MRSHARLLTVVLACTCALAACGSRPSGGTSTGTDTSGADRTSVEQDPDRAAASPATGIPDDFPLSAGMGGPQDSVRTARTGTGLRSLELCGTSPLRGLGTRDRMVADDSGGEALHTRELVLLGSPDEARLVARTFADLATDCDRATTDTGNGTTMGTTTEVRPSPFGSEPAAVLVQGFDLEGEPGPGHVVVHVVPVGAALLVTQMYGEWPDVAEGVDGTADGLRDVVDAMAAFAGGEPTPASTTPTTTPAGTTSSSEIPDGFPLLAGWPESSTADGAGRTGPARDARAVVFTACGETWGHPDHVDRLTAGWDSAEDYRTRQLTTYADEESAAAALDGLVAHEQSCPSEPAGEDGYATEREVRPVALGDEAWAILERDTLDGAPSAFGDSTVVLRVGRAVLVVRHGGHAGYPDGDGSSQVEAIGSQAGTTIAEMCQFTRTGCK